MRRTLSILAITALLVAAIPAVASGVDPPEAPGLTNMGYANIGRCLDPNPDNDNYTWYFYRSGGENRKIPRDSRTDDPIPGPVDFHPWVKWGVAAIFFDNPCSHPVEYRLSESGPQGPGIPADRPRREVKFYVPAGTAAFVSNAEMSRNGLQGLFLDGAGSGSTPNDPPYDFIVGPDGSLIPGS